MSTMKRFRPTRSFSTPIGGPGAQKREKGLVFGAKKRDGAVATKSSARTPVRVDVPRASFEALRSTAKPGSVLEADDTLAPGTMRVTYDDGSSEIVPLPAR